MGGRPPRATNDELIAALQITLDWPEVAAVGTGTIAAEVGVNQPTVLNRLKAARKDETVPIAGLKEGGYVWWLSDPDYY